jgi:hypothetical protein
MRAKRVMSANLTRTKTEGNRYRVDAFRPFGPESQSSDGGGQKKGAKSAISVVSYPELPLPGYGLTLIPNCNAVCGNALGTSIY